MAGRLVRGSVPTRRLFSSSGLVWSTPPPGPMAASSRSRTCQAAGVVVLVVHRSTAILSPCAKRNSSDSHQTNHCSTATKMLRIAALRFGTGRQKMVLERWTSPALSRRMWTGYSRVEGNRRVSRAHLPPKVKNDSPLFHRCRGGGGPSCRGWWWTRAPGCGSCGRSARRAAIKTNLSRDLKKAPINRGLHKGFDRLLKIQCMG
jgi:hypothetical protein